MNNKYNLLLLILIFSNLILIIKSSNYYILNFQQKLNHFSESCDQTFQQQYQIYDYYYEKGGPIFLLVGPERAISETEIYYSSLIQLAAIYKGLIVATEHRYFGTSLPFGKNSFTIENLKQLTIENALEDYISIVQWVKKNETYLDSNGVFSIGGSYAGYLSAKLRIEYSNIIDGSIASAAPVYLYGSGVDTNIWYEKVTESYRDYNLNCSNLIETIFSELYIDFQNQQYSKIQSELNLCSTLDESSGYQLFFYLKNCFSRITEFNYPLKSVFCDSFPLNKTCSTFLEFGSTYKSLIGSLDQCYNITDINPPQCFDFNGKSGGSPLPPLCEKNNKLKPKKGVYFINNNFDDGGDFDGYDPWLYISCTQFITPVNGVGMFSYPSPEWTIEGISNNCQLLFPGSIFNPVKPVLLINQTEITFSNIIFSNGLFDPVRGFSPNSSFSLNVIAINVESMAHTLDIIDQSPFTKPFGSDPTTVINSRYLENYYIGEWIKQLNK